MKKILLIGALAVAGVSLTGCNDFLDDNRYPMSSQTVNSEFWSNSVNVENQINRFYNDFAGYGNRSSTDGTFYFTWHSDDQCGRSAFADWRNTSVPASSTSWTSPYEEIRRACLVIEGVESGSLAGTPEGNNYIGEAKMYRARQYFDLVRRYGDVPLVKTALDPTDEAELFGARTDRAEVVDFIIEDLDYAIANMTTQSSKTTFSVDMVQAMKLEVCLFEGAYQKYTEKNTTRANEYFQKAVTAGEAIASSYPIYSDYTALYKSFAAASGSTVAITDIPEIIFCKVYLKDVFMHAMQDYSSASDGIAGLTKDAFESFLFLDGKPAASTSYNNTDKGVAEGTDALSIQNLLDVRDQRLAMTTYPYVMMTGMPYRAVNTASMWCQSGYGVSKYNNFEVPESDVNTANKNYTCAPLYWGARVYCGILEAKAELGTITDADLTKYMKPLWDRAGFTVAPTLALLNGNNDPENNMGVSSLIWEIRRLRRCELMMDDDIRYWDLIRWHNLDLMAYDVNPDVKLGANIANSPVTPLSATQGEYLDCSYGQSRNWNEKQYFYPIPSDQLQLNSALTQNPGWQ